VAASDLPDTSAFKEALRLARAGQTAEAEEFANHAIYQAEMKFGPASPQYAAAYYDLGRLLSFLGQDNLAVDAYCKASDLEFPGNKQATRDRLSYLIDLGQTLAWLGRLDEAEEVLRRALDGRREFYGRDHSGYAFGLEPLAAVLARKGDAAEALKLISGAVRIFWKNQHARVASALIQRAYILHAAGNPTPPFTGLDGLSDRLVEETAREAVHAVSEADPAISRRILGDLIGLVVARLGESHLQSVNLLIAQSNVERNLGNAEAWADAVRRVLAIHDRLGQSAEALQAVQGLAAALSSAGKNEEAEVAYRDGVARAEKLREPAAQAQAARNFALYLAETGRRGEAEPLLRDALRHAEAAGIPEEVARRQIELDIFLHHGGELDAAP